MKPKIFTKTTLRPSLSWLFVLLLVLLTTLLITTRTLAADADLLVRSFGVGFGNTTGFVGINFSSAKRAVAVDAQGRTIVAGQKDGNFWLARYRHNGTLDTSFGGGQVITNFGGSEEVYDIAIQADGKIVAVGYSNDDFAVARYHSNGSRDSSFHVDGLATYDFDDDIDIAHSVTIQTDGKIVVGGKGSYCTPILGCEWEFAVARLNPDGSLDSSFHGDGKHMIDIGTIYQVGQVAIQSNDKIVLLGGSTDYFGGEERTVIARLHPDGTLDNTLDGDGKFSSGDIGHGLDGFVQPDGKIVVVTSDLKLVRFNIDSSVDQSFGNNGFVNLDGYFNGNLHIEPQTNGGFLVAGDSGDGVSTSADIVIFNFTASGMPDPLFGDIGSYVAFSLGYTHHIQDMALSSNGKIVLLDGSSSARLIRLYPDGSLDRGGRVTNDFSTQYDTIRDTIVQPDGKLLVVGDAGVDFGNGLANRMTVARYQLDGQLDPTFGDNGIKPLPGYDAASQGWAVALDSEDRILVAGNIGIGASGYDFILVRYNPDGTFSSIGNAGAPLTDINGQDDIPQVILVQPDGKIVVAGRGGTDAAFVRYQTDGTLDSGFSGDGKLVVNLGHIDNAISALALQPDGKLVSAGTSDGDFVVIRLLTNGSLDSNFGQSGKMVTDLGGELDQAEAVAVQPDGKIVVGGYGHFEGRSQMVIVRYNADGTLDDSFGTGGIARTDFVVAARANDMVLEFNGDITLAGCIYETDVHFALVRFDSSGQQLAIGADGDLTFAFGGFACAQALAKDPVTSDYYLAGYDFTPAGDEQFAVARVKGNGQNNQPPTAVPDSYTAASGASLILPSPGILDNDSDPDGPALLAVLVEGPANGILYLNPNGQFRYSSTLGFTGQDTFTYQASDGYTHSTPTIVTIQVEPNSPPLPTDDTYLALEDTPLIVAPPGVLGNDNEPDGEPVTIVFEDLPENGSFLFNQDGAFIYTPDPGFSGTELFSYYLRDTVGHESGSATVTINVLPAGSNLPPDALPDSYSTLQNTPQTIIAPGVLDNDSDLNGDPLTAELQSEPAHGNLTLNPDGSFAYAPNQTFNGQDSFTYRASDGITPSVPTTVTIQVEPNSPPIATDDTYQALENTPLTVAAPGILGNDHEPDGEPVTIVFETSPENGTFQFNQDGAFTYTPDPGFSGTESFTYYLHDTAGNESDTATVTINVLPAGSNIPPGAVPDSYGTPQNTPLTITTPGVLDNDNDLNGDPLTAVLENGPDQGSLTLNPDGSFLYTPNQDFSGQDSFSYRANDGSASSTPVSVTITVSTLPDGGSRLYLPLVIR